MTWRLRYIAYPLLVVCAVWMGLKFVHHLNAQSTRASALLSNELVQIPGSQSPASYATNNAGKVGTTNTNAAGSTNLVTPAPVQQTTPPKRNTSAAPSAPGAWVPYLAGFVGSLVLLALLFAYDFSHFFAERFHTFLLDENADGDKHPEYDEAERLWADGRHLEAIQHMRDFLKHRPRAQYAAIRIAEIYEKDLGNFLAAALEYEEILKKPLPAERWGWMAIHLANLYSGKLGQPDKAEEWLRRIVDQHPKTSAARKARQRLGLPEPEEPNEPAGEESSAKPEEPSQSAPPPRPSNLPPGFRPK